MHSNDKEVIALKNLILTTLVMIFMGGQVSAASLDNAQIIALDYDEDDYDGDDYDEDEDDEYDEDEDDDFFDD